MRGVRKRFHRIRINRQIAANRAALVAHRASDPDGFAGREHLYMRDHELREQREALA
ncbi:MAG: hypothetical protein ACXVGC_08500 [Mycobacteriaceae bacterium]